MTARRTHSVDAEPTSRNRSAAASGTLSITAYLALTPLAAAGHDHADSRVEPD